MAVVIDGKAKAASVTEAVRKSAETLEAEQGVKPGLAVVIVGNDPASHAYVNSKSKPSNAASIPFSTRCRKKQLKISF
jgi:methylenetetrahydrofolate dehydrogenase (NADP+)/methenyltetrahydrofolate cyclohydrolase